MFCYLAHWLWKVNDIPSSAFMCMPSKSPLIIVMVPLLSLMEDQINGRLGLGRAIQLTGGLPAEGEVDVASFVFTSPEALLSQNKCRKLLLNDNFIA